MKVTYVSIYLIGEVISSGSCPCKNQCFVEQKYLQFLDEKYQIIMHYFALLLKNAEHQAIQVLNHISTTNI